MSTLRDDNRRLTHSVDELRDERRSQDRKIRDLEHELDQVRAKIVTSAVDGMPSLPVEVVAPKTAPSDPGERVVGVADDGGEIVYEGDAAAGRPAVPDEEPRRAPAPAPRAHVKPAADAEVPTVADRLEVTRKVPVTTPAARAGHAHTRTDRDTPGERASDAGTEYRAAVELLKSGKHDEAIAALRAFIQHFPRHDYADNAQYWLGEAFYVQKDYARALVEFRATIEQYPRGNKVPDALLKVGYCYQALGQTQKARAVLEQVVTLYPKSEPAVLAAKRLESL
jgi:tol-pal system protein YbgF